MWILFGKVFVVYLGHGTIREWEAPRPRAALSEGKKYRKIGATSHPPPFPADAPRSGLSVSRSVLLVVPVSLFISPQSRLAVQKQRLTAMHCFPNITPSLWQTEQGWAGQWRSRGCPAWTILTYVIAHLWWTWRWCDIYLLFITWFQPTHDMVSHRNCRLFIRVRRALHNTPTSTSFTFQLKPCHSYLPPSTNWLLGIKLWSQISSLPSTISRPDTCLHLYLA